MDNSILCPFNFIENFEKYGWLRAVQSNSVLPQTMGGDTPRHPGQRVVTLPAATDNKWWLSALPRTTGVHHSAPTWTTLELFSFVHLCMEFDKKMFYALPRITGGDAPRRPGQRVETLHAAPDNEHAHSAPTRTAWRA